MGVRWLHASDDVVMLLSEITSKNARKYKKP